MSIRHKLSSILLAIILILVTSCSSDVTLLAQGQASICYQTVNSSSGPLLEITAIISIGGQNFHTGISNIYIYNNLDKLTDSLKEGTHYYLYVFKTRGAPGGVYKLVTHKITYKEFRSLPE